MSVELVCTHDSVFGVSFGGEMEIGVVLTIFSKYFLGGISTSIKVDNFSTLGVVGFGIFLFSLNLAVLIVFLKILDGLLVGTYRDRVVR